MPRSSKPPAIAADAAVVGYIRKSNVVFPDACCDVQDRAAYIDQLRRARINELVADAGRDGSIITQWHDDMGISGRGVYLCKRLAFARITQAARAGKVRTIYARDLSRLFRSLTDQELWFYEMERLGVDVRVQDLPRVADDPTRVLIRQVLGAFYQYVADRQGVIISSELYNTVVIERRWVGAGNILGMNYDPTSKGYHIDPATLPKLLTVFAAYIEAGSASGAATVLNRRIDAGDDTAAPLLAKHWSAHSLQKVITNRKYGREVAYAGEVVPMPHLIPESVPQSILDAARAVHRRQRRVTGPTDAD